MTRCERMRGCTEPAFVEAVLLDGFLKAGLPK